MHNTSSITPTNNTPPPAVPWTPRDVSWGLVAFAVWIVIFLILGLIGEYFELGVDPSITVIFGTSLLLIPAWYFTVYKYKVSWAALGLGSFKITDIGVGCGLMTASLLFNLVYASFLGLFGLQMQPDIDIMFNSTAFPFILLFGGAVVAPFVEEVFFRGFVFAGLRNKWSWPKAAAISAVLFAVAHVVPTSILPIFILGFIFAFLYQFSGSIWPAIFMHMLTNTVALSLAYAVSQGWIPAP